ncbi:MAG: zf-HC2 domain-containing protein [Acidobacteriia bacterium]|nr:zf-HC2 domain-containing protein [Terriglobia bacterium]
MADQWTAKLDIYLDGELPASEMQSLDAHVRSCPSCAADVLNRLQLKRTLQSAGKRYQARPEFRKRIQKQIATRPQTSAVRLWIASAAALAVLLVGGLFLAHLGELRLARQRTFSQVADLHVATLASPNPVDVVSSDRHTVKPWFEGKIPFTFNLPELQNSEFTLVGGRMAYLRHSPGAHLIFQVRKHRISVLIFQDRDMKGLSSDSGAQTELSFNCESWSHGGLRYFVISDASPDDIRQLVELLKAAARK